MGNSESTPRSTELNQDDRSQLLKNMVDQYIIIKQRDIELEKMVSDLAKDQKRYQSILDRLDALASEAERKSNVLVHIKTLETMFSARMPSLVSRDSTIQDIFKEHVEPLESDQPSTTTPSLSLHVFAVFPDSHIRTKEGRAWRKFPLDTTIAEVANLNYTQQQHNGGQVVFLEYVHKASAFSLITIFGHDVEEQAICIDLPMQETADFLASLKANLQYRATEKIEAIEIVGTYSVWTGLSLPGRLEDHLRPFECEVCVEIRLIYHRQPAVQG